MLRNSDGIEASRNLLMPLSYPDPELELDASSDANLFKGNTLDFCIIADSGSGNVFLNNTEGTGRPCP